MEKTLAGNPRRFTRNEIKYPLMQAGYGQQKNGTISQLEEDMGENYFEGVYEIFEEAVEDVIPGFYSIMNFVNDLWSPEWLETGFTMPDGFHVKIKPTSSDWFKFKLYDKYEITAKVGGVAKEKRALILYVSIIHATDAFIMREVIRRAPFDILPIHDCVRVHPNDAEGVKKIYNEVLADINEMRLFEDIIEQLTGMEVETLGTDIKREEILEAKYSIC